MGRTDPLPGLELPFSRACGAGGEEGAGDRGHHLPGADGGGGGRQAG